jgi:hypothetical protein
MPEATATLELDGEALRQVAMRAYLRGMRDRGRDFRPCYDEAMNIIFSHEAQLFRQEGETLDEARWAELSPAYNTWKNKAYPGRAILELTGKLVRQLTGKSGDHYEKRQMTKLVMGSNYPIKWRGGADDLGGLHMSGRAGHGETFTTVRHALPDWQGGGTWETQRHSKASVPPMPARPPIRTSEYIANELADLFGDHLMGVRAQTGVG